MTQSTRSGRVSFLASNAIKLLHKEAIKRCQDLSGIYAAGLLFLLEDPTACKNARQRLREWENAYGNASLTEIRAFLSALEQLE